MSYRKEFGLLNSLEDWRTLKVELNAIFIMDGHKTVWSVRESVGLNKNGSHRPIYLSANHLKGNETL